MPELSEEELRNKAIQRALEDPTVTAAGFESSRVFALIKIMLNSSQVDTKKLIRQMKTVYMFVVTNAAGQEARWYVDMKKTGSIHTLQDSEKAREKPNVIFYLKDSDLVRLATGAVLPQKLFEAKRIRIRGNLDQALLVGKILKQERTKLAQVPRVPAKL